MNSGLHKVAAAAIRTLRSENEDLQKELEKRAEAEKLAFELFKEGHIVAEDLESKLNSFYEKDLDELKLIRRASEFSKTAHDLSGFKLQGGPELPEEYDNPIIRCLLEDL